MEEAGNQYQLYALRQGRLREFLTLGKHVDGIGHVADSLLEERGIELDKDMELFIIDKELQYEPKASLHQLK